MTAERLNIDLDPEKLVEVFKDYISEIRDIANLYPNDINRVMTSYPSGSNHYTMTKRGDEVWDKIETDSFMLLTRFTKVHTRMISVYFKTKKTVDKYIEDVIIALRQTENIEENKEASIALVYAGPKFRLEKHIDTRGLVRYHIPIVISEDSYFETYDPYTRHYPKVGEVWRLETHVPHSAQNDDEKNYRIHAIVDFI